MLTADDVKILEFEREWSGRHIAKESAIQRVFGTTAARHYQRVDQLLSRQDALEADPMLVHRLTRLRDELADARANRSFRKASEPAGY